MVSIRISPDGSEKSGDDHRAPGAHEQIPEVDQHSDSKNPGGDQQIPGGQSRRQARQF